MKSTKFKIYKDQVFKLEKRKFKYDLDYIKERFSDGYFKDGYGEPWMDTAELSEDRYWEFLDFLEDYKDFDDYDDDYPYSQIELVPLTKEEAEREAEKQRAEEEKLVRSQIEELQTRLVLLTKGKKDDTDRRLDLSL